MHEADSRSHHLPSWQLLPSRTNLEPALSCTNSAGPRYTNRGNMQQLARDLPGGRDRLLPIIEIEVRDALLPSHTCAISMSRFVKIVQHLLTLLCHCYLAVFAHDNRPVLSTKNYCRSSGKPNLNVFMPVRDHQICHVTFQLRTMQRKLPIIITIGGLRSSSHLMISTFAKDTLCF